MAKPRKFQITEPHTVDDYGKEIPKGTIISIRGELKDRYVNKGVFISADGAPEPKTLVNATPDNVEVDPNADETAEEKQERLRKRGSLSRKATPSKS